MYKLHPIWFYYEHYLFGIAKVFYNFEINWICLLIEALKYFLINSRGSCCCCIRIRLRLCIHQHFVCTSSSSSFLFWLQIDKLRENVHRFSKLTPVQFHSIRSDSLQNESFKKFTFEINSLFFRWQNNYRSFVRSFVGWLYFNKFQLRKNDLIRQSMN